MPRRSEADLIPSLETAQCKNQIVVYKPEPIPSNNDRPNKTEAFRSCVPAEIYRHTLKTNPDLRESQHLTEPVLNFTDMFSKIMCILLKI